MIINIGSGSCFFVCLMDQTRSDQNNEMIFNSENREKVSQRYIREKTPYDDDDDGRYDEAISFLISFIPTKKSETK